MKLISIILIIAAAVLMVIALPILIIGEYAITLSYTCNDMVIWRNRCLRIKQRLGDATDRIVSSITIVKEVF